MNLLIPGALLIDLIIGDPRCIPHPVIIIGKLISRLERFLRSCCYREGIKGRGSTAGIYRLLINIFSYLGFNLVSF
ncbi:hypothetical protein N752_02995 [Desulforamulus aquiferis]|nr:cobalamin biosynthesis protein [Desulforamulus aquiferis]RYD06654.1 hypothetical protein N752_02995 [Desulforamulus aquiferis]